MRLRLLQIEVETPNGAYSCSVPFEDGLVVIRGPNTTGKSTCLMAVLYVLGLEGMLTAKHQVPLPHAVQEYLEDDDGNEIPVSASRGILELETAAGAFLTVQRTIKGEVGEPNSKLIRTWEGRALTENRLSEPSRDFHVRGSGAAQREAGFHYHLAQLLGWVLPEVPRFDGSTCPLYMEAIFPLLFIEQKRGWLGLQARMPTHLQIREAQARAVEFLLKLDADRARVDQAKLEARERHLREQWQAAHAALLTVVRGAHGEVEGIPSTSVEPWPDREAQLNVPEGDGWMNINHQLELRKKRLAELVATAVPTTGADATRTSDELKAREERLADTSALVTRLQEEFELVSLEQRAAESRAAALRRDLQRNKDAQKLQKLGSLSQLSVVKDLCPTCHQPVSGHLVTQGSASVMSIDENIAFIDEMLETVQATAHQASRRAESLSRQLSALRGQQSALRASIRAMRRSLVQDDRAPSLAHVEERVRLEHDIERLTSTVRRFNEVVGKLRERHRELNQSVDTLSKLREQPLSALDNAKLGTLRQSFKSQIEEYGLRSLAESRILIDPRTYRPAAEGMPDLEFELSGSDLIRAIWAYYLGLLETARQHETNHPGFLIVDEPKQQGAEVVALGEMLRRASRAGAAKQQVIVASAESTDVLREMLGDAPFTEIAFEGRWALRRRDDAAVS